MWNWFEQGGIFMWPIAVCSLLGVAVIIDRAYAHYQTRLNYDRFLQKLRQDLKLCPMKKPDWLEDDCCPVCRVAALYMDHLRQPERIRNEAIKREGDRALQRLTRRMSLLSSIAHVSPLFGLLGTVYGLVETFQAIEASGGRVEVEVLAGGIWAALITTVAGLCVGIPALLGHQYFHHRVEQTAARMKETASELDEWLMHYCQREGVRIEEGLAFQRDPELKESAIYGG